jgi:hypothetical protein
MCNTSLSRKTPLIGFLAELQNNLIMEKNNSTQGLAPHTPQKELLGLLFSLHHEPAWLRARDAGLVKDYI